MSNDSVLKSIVEHTGIACRMTACTSNDGENFKLPLKQKELHVERQCDYTPLETKGVAHDSAMYGDSYGNGMSRLI